MGQEDPLKLHPLLVVCWRCQHPHAFKELDPLTLCVGENTAKHLIDDILEFGPGLAKMRADEERRIDTKGCGNIGQLCERDLPPLS